MRRRRQVNDMRLEQRSVRRAKEVQLSQEDASRRLELNAMDTVCEHCGALHCLDEGVHLAGSQPGQGRLTLWSWPVLEAVSAHERIRLGVVLVVRRLVLRLGSMILYGCSISHQASMCA